MISYIENSNDFIVALEGIKERYPLGYCRIGSLHKAYSKYSDMADFYSCDNGVICRLGANLFIAGDIDSDELVDFVSILGIKAASGEIGRWSKSFLADGFNVLETDVLQIELSSNSSILKDTNMNFNIERRAVFNMLSEQENMGDALSWISDIAVRQRQDSCLIGIYDDKSTAGAYFLYEDIALISGVITKAEYRGMGYARKAINALLYALKEMGITSCYVIAADEDVTKLYEKLGFNKIGKHHYITAI